MPSLVYTCNGCGAHHSVSDRYFGRQLRCPECGGLFTVEAPAEGVEPSQPEVPAARVAPGRWWPWLLLAVPLVAAVVWLSLPKAAANRLFSRQVFAGQVLVVGGQGQGAYRYGAVDREQAAMLVAMAKDGIEAPGEPPAGVIRLAAGTRVAVVEYRKSESIAVARVLDGPWSGRKVWIPVAWLL